MKTCKRPTNSDGDAPAKADTRDPVRPGRGGGTSCGGSGTRPTSCEDSSFIWGRPLTRPPEPDRFTEKTCQTSRRRWKSGTASRSGKRTAEPSTSGWARCSKRAGPTRRSHMTSIEATDELGLLTAADSASSTSSRSSATTGAIQRILGLSLPNQTGLPVPNTDNRDHLIARAINRKGKGWAWREGRPINFKDYVNVKALMGWVRDRPWFAAQAQGEHWTLGRPDITWSQVYLDLCVEHAEGRCTNAQFAEVVRNMVAAAMAVAGV